MPNIIHIVGTVFSSATTTTCVDVTCASSGKTFDFDFSAQRNPVSMEFPLSFYQSRDGAQQYCKDLYMYPSPTPTERCMYFGNRCAQATCHMCTDDEFRAGRPSIRLFSRSDVVPIDKYRNPPRASTMNGRHIADEWTLHMCGKRNGNSLKTPTNIHH